MPSNKKLLQAAAGNAGGTLGYAEDVFSTYLYEGTGATQTITNGIDLDGEGGMVWLKRRSGGSGNWSDNWLFDSERGDSNGLRANLTNANFNIAPDSMGFSSTGLEIPNYIPFSESGTKYASWTFRKAKKFFDVVTYTGDGVAGRTVSHDLGSVPAVMLVKSTDVAGNWVVYHKDIGTTKYLYLNTTAAEASFDFWNATAPTDTEFTLGSFGSNNASGGTFVAYLFASDAGGYGDDGSENIIKCGSFVGNGTYTQFQDLGWEPQWVLFKNASAVDDWWIYDSMRGLPVSGGQNRIAPNLNSAEAVTGGTALKISATGFTPSAYSTSGQTYIYMAIRRPMKTPESGTEVFSPNIWTGDGTANRVRSLPLTPDLAIGYRRDGTYKGHLIDRLRGKVALVVNNASADASPYAGIELVGANSNNTSILDASDGGSTGYNINGWNYVAHYFKRATGFMDVVAYTGNGTAGNTVAHNLGVAPEFMIVKPRGSGNWATYNKFNTATDLMYFNENYATDTNSHIWSNTTPTDTVFTLGGGFTNTSNATFIAYLFASLDGVSKVGNYTGTGSAINVDCGFSSGARFILIKRSDSTTLTSGDWYVWDSARGIVAGNDPYILVNSTASEVTNTDYIDPLSSGFTVTSSAPAALNASGGNYIFLAIA